MELKETIRQFVIKKLISSSQDIEVDFETNLLRSGLIDSMALMTLVNFIENEFNVKIPFTDFTVANFQSINAMASYIESKKA